MSCVNYIIEKKTLKQALNHGLVLKKVIRVIKFTQEAWLIPYTNMISELKKRKKKKIKKYFIKLMIFVVFGKTLENVRKHRDIKLVITEGRRNYLVSEPNNYKTKNFQIIY